jgi:hypothetical protein
MPSGKRRKGEGDNANSGDLAFWPNRERDDWGNDRPLFLRDNYGYFWRSDWDGRFCLRSFVACSALT